MFEREQEFLALVDVVERIFQSSTRWDTKYALIFSTTISEEITDLGMAPDYADPDTTYEEDVTAYVVALRGKAKEIRKAIGGT